MLYLNHKTRIKHRNKAPQHWSWQFFFFGMSQKKGNKSQQNKQKGLYQTKKLLSHKGNNQQNQKAIYGMGENIYKSYLLRVNIQST